jgi:hypothetical protein
MSLGQDQLAWPGGPVDGGVIQKLTFHFHYESHYLDGVGFSRLDRFEIKSKKP